MKTPREYALLIEKFFPLGRGSYCAIVNHKNKPVVQIYIFLCNCKLLVHLQGISQATFHFGEIKQNLHASSTLKS